MSSKLGRMHRYLGLGVAAATMGLTAQAHHSFAAYDMQKTVLITGVATRVNPDANHLQIFFAPMKPDRTNVERDKDNKPIIYAVDMSGSAASAQDGVSVNSFPPGTVFTVALHPQRNGETAGFREGPLFKCPVREDGKSIPPAAGKHCDSVQGATKLGNGNLPANAVPYTHVAH